MWVQNLVNFSNVLAFLDNSFNYKKKSVKYLKWSSAKDPILMLSTLLTLWSLLQSGLFLREATAKQHEGN